MYVLLIDRFERPPRCRMMMMFLSYLMLRLMQWFRFCTSNMITTTTTTTTTTTAATTTTTTTSFTASRWFDSTSIEFVNAVGQITRLPSRNVNDLIKAIVVSSEIISSQIIPLAILDHSNLLTTD